jgi:hypothetical protein
VAAATGSAVFEGSTFTGEVPLSDLPEVMLPADRLDVFGSSVEVADTS